MRWGLGPVFWYECLTAARRWQTFVLRSGAVALLLCAMSLIAVSHVSSSNDSWNEYASLGESYFVAMIGVELALVMLAAPAATAGAICLDRARGTLAHMLVTDLSDAEIVLGKLAARLLPVFGVVACTWPVLAISSLLGGIDPIALSLALGVILAVAVLGCTLALALSVWVRKTHEAILTTYTVFIIGLLLWPVWYTLGWGGRVAPPPAGTPPRWTLLLNPFYLAFAPYADPGNVSLVDYLGFFGVCLGASLLLTVLAVWRTRPAACRGEVEGGNRRVFGLLGRLVRVLPAPSLDASPVLWREWHRTRPSRWMLVIVGLLMGTTAALCVIGAIEFLRDGANLHATAVWKVVGIAACELHIVFGLLMLAVIAPLSMAEERQRGSLDILAATSLSTRTIVIGKWLGTFRLAFFMTLAPGLILLAMATTRGGGAVYASIKGMPVLHYWHVSLAARLLAVLVVFGTILAHSALITSIGLAAAVWIKRQSRAIGLCISIYVLIVGAWPLAVSVLYRNGPDNGRVLSCLSPAIVCGGYVNQLSQRTYGNSEGLLESSLFWALEVSLLAAGLLWLLVRTFETCFDRIPRRPPRHSVPAMLTMLLAAMIAGGSLVLAGAAWIQGVQPGWNGMPAPLAASAITLALVGGLALVAWDALRSGQFTPPGEHAGIQDATGSSALQQWRLSFRLVLLLAAGPAVLAPLLALAPWAPQYTPQFSKNAAGLEVVTGFVRDTQHVRFAQELNLGQRLAFAGLWIVTMLVHGAAAVSAVMLLRAAGQWSRAFRVISMSLATLILVILPIALFLLVPLYDVPVAAWSFGSASRSLLAQLLTRRSYAPGDALRCVLLWDLVVIVLVIILARWAVRSSRAGPVAIPGRESGWPIDAVRGRGHAASGTALELIVPVEEAG